MKSLFSVFALVAVFATCQSSRAATFGYDMPQSVAQVIPGQDALPDTADTMNEGDDTDLRYSWLCYARGVRFEGHRFSHVGVSRSHSRARHLALSRCRQFHRQCYILRCGRRLFEE